MYTDYKIEQFLKSPHQRTRINTHVPLGKEFSYETEIEIVPSPLLVHCILFPPRFIQRLSELKSFKRAPPLCHTLSSLVQALRQEIRVKIRIRNYFQGKNGEEKKYFESLRTGNARV